MLPGAAFAVASALVGGYAISLYTVTLAGAVPIGVATPPLAPGLRSQPAVIYVHAFASGSALILCGLQLLPAFRRSASAGMHRALGWSYVLFCRSGLNLCGSAEPHGCWRHRKHGWVCDAGCAVGGEHCGRRSRAACGSTCPACPTNGALCSACLLCCYPAPLLAGCNLLQGLWEHLQRSLVAMLGAKRACGRGVVLAQG